MDLSTYRSMLSGGVNNMGQKLRKQSEEIMNIAFDRDPAYKKVYLLTENGWEWFDAHYSQHSVPSIAKDDVDYYLQFRPYVHFPIGSYVIIPDDTDIDINLTEEEKRKPFTQPVEKRTQWYMIVDKIDIDTFVRYSVLKCNWNFQWIFNGELYESFGAIRNANSYTSGVWSAEYSDALDNIIGFWIPDTHYVYGDNLHNLDLYDTRSLTHEIRMMLTTNVLDPKIYKVTKLIELSPKGILKVTGKQDEFYPIKDNAEKLLCDYYDEMGNPLLKQHAKPIEQEELSCSIISMITNEEGVSEESTSLITGLKLGKSYLYKAIFPKETNAIWNIKCITEEVLNPEYYEKLVKLTTFDNNMVSIRLGKASSLNNHIFELSVKDEDEKYWNKVVLEVKA